MPGGDLSTNKPPLRHGPRRRGIPDHCGECLGDMQLSPYRLINVQAPMQSTLQTFISCSLVSMCIIAREPAEGMERDVTTVQGQKWLMQPGHPPAPQDSQPSWALPAVGHWFGPVTPFSTPAGPMPGSPCAPSPPPSLQSTQMPVDTLGAGGEEPVMPSHPPSPGFGQAGSFVGDGGITVLL